MRRWLSLLLLLILPLQLSWAVAAGYCQHESAEAAAASPHFGHHEHRPRHPAQADAGDSLGAHAATGDQNTPPGDAGDHHGRTPSFDEDCCVHCHLNCVKTLSSPVDPVPSLSSTAETFSPRQDPLKPSLLPSRIERPNWRA